MKTCIIAFARNEETQLPEWIDYHLNTVGFSHIFILDNNDENDKLIITDNRVSVVPYHVNCDEIFKREGKDHSHTQVDAYNYLIPYVSKMNYEYAAFIDIDEFMVFKQHSGINDFIEKEMIEKNNNIAEILWEIYDDNDIIWEKDCKKSIRETYTRIQTNKKDIELFDLYTYPKCVIKLYPDTQFGYVFDFSNEEGGPLFDLRGGGNVHWPKKELMQGEPYNPNFIDKNVAVINHYRTQCLEKYIKHKVLNQNFKHIYGDDIVRIYFTYNKMTKEKLDYFKNICKKYSIDIDDIIQNYYSWC